MAVVGGGPAGCAAAIVLSTGGASVVVLERSTYAGVRVGETLPPEVRLPLERLRVWDAFQGGGHAPSPGIVAVWGGPESHTNDFILNPYGCGWRVDRNRFDAMLATTARDAGADVRTGTSVDGCAKAGDGGWDVAVSGGGGSSSLRAGFVVDATGRASTFHRHLGARRVVHDRLVALVGFVAGTWADRRALIEATEDGWWYSAPLADGGLVLAFHTDARRGLRERWDEHLSVAPRTSARVGGAAPEDVRVVAANSHRLQPVAAESWLAVGDAACAHDPICGLGIHWSLESGIAGAEAIVAGTTAAYAQDISRAFDRYLSTHIDYYRAESRWPDATFWRRRQRADGW